MFGGLEMTECNYTPQDFIKACEKFRKTISTENEKKLEKIKELKKINDIESNDKKKKAEDSVKEAIRTAVDLAYNDAKRTIHGIGGKSADAKENVIKIFNEYFDDEAPNSEEAFKEKQAYLCDAWVKSFKESSSLGTYGKAQKIVNMTFKYLYCYADDNLEKLKGYFQYCHMPLDSFTLEWFKRTICSRKEKIFKTKVGSWSSMSKSNESNITQGKSAEEKYAYLFYVDKIQEYINNNKISLSPLQLEFIIWPKMQLELATENYLFALTDEYKKTAEKEKIRKESLDYKMALVVKKIKDLDCKKQ